MEPREFVWLVLPGSDYDNDIADWQPASVFTRWQDAVTWLKEDDEETLVDPVAEFAAVVQCDNEVRVTMATGEEVSIVRVPVIP